MKLGELLLWQPDVRARAGIFVCFVALAIGVAYLHTLTGLAYEFHLIFILLVLVTAWFAGTRAGYALALLSVAEIDLKRSMMNWGTRLGTNCWRRSPG